MEIGLLCESIDLLSNETKVNAFRKEMIECVKLIAKQENGWVTYATLSFVGVVTNKLN